MKWIIEFATSLLAKLIPWMFSGQNVETVGRTEGLEGLDRESVTGVGDLTPEDLPDL